MKRLLALLLFASATFYAYPIEKGTFGYDFCINFSSKAGYGVMLSIRYFVADSLSVDVHLGGMPGAFLGIGSGVSYFPFSRFPYMYLSPGVSYLSGGGDSKDDHSHTTTVVTVFTNVGLTTRSFGMPFLGGMNDEIQLPSYIFAEAGVARCLHRVDKIDGQVEAQGDTFMGKKWLIPNMVIGLRQLSIKTY